ncbi:MAG: hypothetical protein EBT71_04140 [Alphaproteobacteria bacterium]|nr:hypothetical protein [Alphaproteobacteria bacterium]
MFKFYFYSFCFTFFIYSLTAQETPKLLAKFIDQPLEIDGKLEEAVWEKANASDAFWQFFPK